MNKYMKTSYGSFYFIGDSGNTLAKETDLSTVALNSEKWEQ